MGSINARLLTHLRISFPATERVDDRSGETRLREDTSQNLQLIRNECTGLKPLETLVGWILRDMDRGFSTDVCAHRGGEVE